MCSKHSVDRECAGWREVREGAASPGRRSQLHVCWCLADASWSFFRCLAGRALPPKCRSLARVDSSWHPHPGLPLQQSSCRKLHPYVTRQHRRNLASSYKRPSRTVPYHSTLKAVQTHSATTGSLELGPAAQCGLTTLRKRPRRRLRFNSTPEGAQPHSATSRCDVPKAAQPHVSTTAAQRDCSGQWSGGPAAL